MSRPWPQPRHLRSCRAAAGGDRSRGRPVRSRRSGCGPQGSAWRNLLRAGYSPPPGPVARPLRWLAPHRTSGYNRPPSIDQAFCVLRSALDRKEGPPRRCQHSAGRAQPPTSATGLRPELRLRRGLGLALPARLIRRDRALPPTPHQRHGPLHGRPPSPGARLPEVEGRCGRGTGQRRRLEVGQCPRRCRLPGTPETANISTHDWYSFAIARRVAPDWVPTSPQALGRQQEYV